MSFTKTKLKTTTTTDITQAYFATKKRNSIVSVVAIIIATIVIAGIGWVVLSKFSQLSISFQLPRFVTNSLPFLASEPVDEKLNILLTGIGGA
jgi:biotin transporter BioY